jgi:hypothetical protein
MIKSGKDVKNSPGTVIKSVQSGSYYVVIGYELWAVEIKDMFATKKVDSCDPNTIYVDRLDKTFYAVRSYNHMPDDKKFEIIDNVNWKIGSRLTDNMAIPGTKIRSVNTGNRYQIIDYDRWKKLWESKSGVSHASKTPNVYYVQNLNENYQGVYSYTYLDAGLRFNVVLFNGLGDSPSQISTPVTSIPTGIITPNNCPGHEEMTSLYNIVCKHCGFVMQKGGI